MTANDLDLKYGRLNAGEFAGSPVLSGEERARLQERQFAEGYVAAALGRAVGAHEPAAVQAGAKQWAIETGRVVFQVEGAWCG